ncbi:MAG: tRNA (adenosine(37)-N6)-threonylcarbamoyltransferase complex transferase subunit TsaD [Proteobacteria bacterium]|nr:tRNA (adenosine(37)-N6)-threonylcarbamoyltransferase complex transferase subunit TsaD [Pseudomonadota bacterium]
MLMLGIETSCDETAAAVVRGDRRVLADLVRSQVDEHRIFGGVVPEIAARAHLDHLDRLVAAALDEAGVRFADLDGVAATAGPGLIGGVMVGLMTAKAVAAVHRIPLVAVNHLEGHALSVRLIDDVAFPYLLLLVSGGHCQLIIVEGVGRYVRLGTTIDDAVGEAFDKTAKLLGLGYPGGPAVERAAREGDPERFALPRPLMRRAGCDFSFSGLKTAVRHAVEALPEAPSGRDVADLCAGFQAAVADVQASWADLSAIRLSIAAQTTKAWLAVIEAREQVTLGTAIVESFASSADRVRRRYEEGVVSSVDLRLALSALANSRALLELRKQRFDGATRQLEILLGQHHFYSISSAANIAYAVCIKW